MITKISTLTPTNFSHKTRPITQQRPQFVSQLQADTVSFGNIVKPQNPTEKSNTEIALAFADRLIGLKKFDEKSLRNEIKNFFEENEIKNVEIKSISEIQDKSSNHPLVGAFSGRFGDDLKFEKGTLYLGRIPNRKNDVEFAVYCAALCHELTHALEFSKNEDSLGIGDLGRNAETQGAIFQYGGFINSKIEEILVYKPFYAFMNNYEAHGLSFNDYYDVAMSTNTYNFAVLKKPIKFNREDIEKPIAPSLGFEKFANGLLDNILDVVVTDVIPEVEPKQAKRAFLGHLINHYQNEIEGHSVSSGVVKKMYNIKGQTLNDLPVAAFEMMLKVLEDKLNSL